MISASSTPNGEIRLAIGPADYKSGGRSYHFVAEYTLQQMPAVRRHLETIGMEFIALHERRPAEIWVEPETWDSGDR